MKKSIYLSVKFLWKNRSMFDTDSYFYGYLYCLVIAFFGFGLPFALFSTIMSFYYFFSWIIAGKTQLKKAAAYCLVDGIFSLTFCFVGIWMVLYEAADLLLILVIGMIINVPHILIARTIRRKVFGMTPAKTETPIPEPH